MTKKPIDADKLWDRGVRKSLDDSWTPPPQTAGKRPYSSLDGDIPAGQLTWLGKVVLGVFFVLVLGGLLWWLL